DGRPRVTLDRPRRLQRPLGSLHPPRGSPLGGVLRRDPPSGPLAQRTSPPPRENRPRAGRGRDRPRAPAPRAESWTPTRAPPDRDGRAASGERPGVPAPAATRANGRGDARNRRRASGRPRCVPSDSGRGSRTSVVGRASPNARPPREKAGSRSHLAATGPDLAFLAARIPRKERPEAFV